jgi:release factor glutamine methyltransferase
MTTYAEVLAGARATLASGGVESAALDARLLLAAATNLDMAALIAGSGDDISELEQAALKDQVSRRLAGEPVARIIGETEFWGLPVRLNAATLVPRPDTETLVETVLREARRLPPDIALCDLGTGSGAIAIALLTELPKARAVATDVSEDALSMARFNAERAGVLPRLSLRKASFGEGPDGPFDVVVANPPYIRSDAIGGLEREVRDYDPFVALDGGPDGLAAYRAILGRAGNLLGKGGLLAFEVGYDQAEAVAALCRKAGLGNVSYVKDLAGRSRVVVARADVSGTIREAPKKALGKVG